MSIIPTLEKVKENLKNSPELIIGGSLMTFDLDEPDEFYTEKAEQELRETPEVAEEALKILMDLLADEEDLFIPMEKEFLQSFLRRCKWYPDSAFRMVKRHYDYKRRHPELYTDLLPSKERHLFVSGVVTPLPRRSAKGERIVIIQSGHRWKPKEISLNQILRGLLMFVDVAAAEVKTQIAGVHVIVDVEGLSLSHVTYFTPSYASALVDFVARCMQVRLQGIHIVNNPFIFDMVFAFFKPFLNAKFREKIFIHGDDRASLLKHIDAKTLPKQLGGEFDYPDEPVGEPIYTYASMFEDFFKDNSRYGYVTEL